MSKSFFSLLICLLVIIFANLSFGQARMAGAVFDKETSKPLEGVTITFLNVKDSTINYTVTNEGGAYSVDRLKNGKYAVSASIIGYLNQVNSVEIAGKPIYQSFQLESVATEIDSVDLVLTPAVTVRGDTMEFDAGRYQTREFADADELLEQIPGVELDEEGNIKAQGEAVSRIIVDGTEFFSTDPKVALKMLPAEIISKIQIIDEKSEQARFSGFDDGKRSKVINIVTKPDRRKGYFGRAIAGKGDGDKYNVNANANIFNQKKRIGVLLMGNNINETNAGQMGRGRFGSSGGNNQNTEQGITDTYIGTFSFNNQYLKEKMEVSADYNFRWNSTETNTLSDIEYLVENRANQFQNQTRASDNRGNNHTASGRVRWEIDSANQVDFRPRISYTSNNSISSNYSATSLMQATPINRTDRSNTNENNNFSLGGDLTVMHRFKKAGRTISLSANGNTNSNDALGLNLATTEFYEDALLDRIDTNNNRSVTNGYGSGFNTRLSLTENITKLSRLQGNYSFRNTSNYSNRETFEFLAETGQIGELRDRLSNEFRNDFNFHSGGLSYSYNRRDTLRIQLGLNYQYGLRVNNRTVPVDLVTRASFGSWLPEATAVYYFTKDKNIEFNYNTSTNTPSINQLQDFINNQNELRITNGNPNLRQEYSHIFRLQYRDVDRQSGRSVNSSVNVDYVNDRIVNSVLMTDSTIQLYDDVILGAGGQYTIPVNLDGSYNVRVSNNLGLPIKKWKINTNFNTNLYLNNNLGIVNGENVPSKSYGFNQGVNLNSNFSRKYIVAIGYTLNGSYTDNPTNEINPRYHIYTHRFNNRIDIEFLKNFNFNSSLLYLYNGGINGAEGIQTTIWNSSVGYRFMKNRSGEISVKGYDLLNNAQNVSRQVNQISASNITSNTLNRYFLLSFTYNLRNFGGSFGGAEDRSGSGRRGPGSGGFVGRPR